MIEREQLLKERSQVLQEMQVGLRTLDEARERLQEMDELQRALMKRLGHTRQQFSFLDSDDGLLTFGEDGSSDGLI
jgi:exonuclease VII small subunit